MIRQDPKSWEVGYQDGLKGLIGTQSHRSSVPDKLAYSSGYIEGKAVRLSFPKTNAKESSERIEETLNKKRPSI